MLKKVGNLLQKLFEIMSNSQKFLGLVVLACSLFAAVLETLGVSIIVPLVNVLLQPAKLLENELVQKLTTALGIQTNTELIVAVVVGVVIIYVFKNLYFIFFCWLKLKYACKVQRECSVYMMKSYIQRGYEFFLKKNVNELMQGVNGDVISLYQIVLGLLQIVTQVLIALFICIYMCYADWQIALGIIIAAVICLLLILVLFRKRMFQAGVKTRTHAIKASQTLLQAFHGIKEVMVMRKQRYFIKEFEDNTNKRQGAVVTQSMGAEIPAYIIEGICISGIMIILCVRIVNIPNPENFVAVLASFAVGAFRVLPALGKISNSVNTISSSIPGFNSVYDNITEARKTSDPYFEFEIEDDKSYEDISFSEAISVNNVSFAYDPGTKKVLDNVNIKIRKGESVALVGESGAGKSTLADLILGVLVPDTGKILLDDTDIREIPNTWGKLVGYVPQSIYLSDASVCQNVAFGIETTEIDGERVKLALEKAELLDFVLKLPDGLNTRVGDRGVRLSGGQRQRIGIARALYHNPDILILDEATSALDNETEKAIMQAIDSLRGKLTLIIIAHRLTTIKDCDVIYEISSGNIVQRSYEELVN